MVDVTDRASVPVLIVLHDASSLPTDRLPQKLSRVVAVRLTTLRTIDAVESDADRSVIVGQDIDRVAINDLNDLCRELTGNSS